MVLVLCLIAGLYSLAAISYQFVHKRPLVHHIFLFTGAVAFGVGVALMGQIYNSHADSYLLFLIWLIPVLILSVLTRHQLLYVLSYILFHLMVFFYLTPTVVAIFRTEGEIVLILLSVACVNAGLFLASRNLLFRSPVLHYSSIVVFHVIWLVLTWKGNFEAFTLVLNIAYLLLFIALLYWFIKVVQKQVYVVLTAIALAVYGSLWMIRWMSEHFSELFLFYVLAFVGLLVAGNIVLIRLLRKKFKLLKKKVKSLGGKSSLSPLSVRLVLF